MVQVCDQPHPLLVAQIVRACMVAHLDDTYAGMKVGSAGGALVRLAGLHVHM